MKGIKVLQCKYLNNIVGQDHSAIKQRIVIGCGFKEFESANDFTDLPNYFMHSTPWFHHIGNLSRYDIIRTFENNRS